MPRFIVAFINDNTLEGVLLGVADTLEEARTKRKVTGDLVFHADTCRINTSAEWLWDDERATPQCYAQRAQRNHVQFLALLN